MSDQKSSLPNEDISALFQMARDKSSAGRKALVNAVSDLFFNNTDVLSDREKALMTDILRQIIHDVEMSVRRELAELRDNGALQQIYAHLISLFGWDRLVALQIFKMSEAQVRAAGQAV